MVMQERTNEPWTKKLNKSAAQSFSIHLALYMQAAVSEASTEKQADLTQTVSNLLDV